MVLMLDNLDTHAIQSLAEIFPPTRARALAMGQEIHATSRHGSWPNLAEIEAWMVSSQP